MVMDFHFRFDIVAVCFESSVLRDLRELNLMLKQKSLRFPVWGDLSLQSTAFSDLRDAGGKRMVAGIPRKPILSSYQRRGSCSNS